jgi:hypothetical protein
MYSAGPGEVSSADAEARVAADQRRIRGRAVELGRTIVVAEDERRQQLRTSAGSLLLLIWRRSEGGWYVHSTAELDSVLYWADSNAAVFYPPSTDGESPGEVLLRLARRLKDGKLTEAQIRGDFTLGASRIDGLPDLVAALSGGDPFPTIVDGQHSGDLHVLNASAGASRFEVSFAKGPPGWRIAKIVAGPVLSIRKLGKEDVDEIGSLLATFTSALAKQDGQTIRLAAIDGRGAVAKALTLEEAGARLREWRELLGESRSSARLLDLHGAPAGDRVLMPFADSSSRFAGSVWVGRWKGSWRVVDVIRPGVQTQVVPRPGGK